MTTVLDSTNTERAVIERALELILDIVQGMLAQIDKQDGDPDLEPSLGYHAPDMDPRLVDVEAQPPTEPLSPDTRRQK